jgi:hypothetical protein
MVVMVDGGQMVMIAIVIVSIMGGNWIRIHILVKGHGFG